MRILLVHNYYRQPGGEDQVYSAETSLLRSMGHDVFNYQVSNGQIRDSRFLRNCLNTVWNRHAYAALEETVRHSSAEVVHFHNTFPLLSPSCYYAARKQGAAVVQTLHNYRLLCPAATFFRDGSPCQDCLARVVPWPGIVHACYRQNRAATATAAGMLLVHRAMRTWLRAVDLFVAPAEFARRQFVAGGFPPHKVMVKPNFVSDDPGVGAGGGDYVLYAGRLSPEKGPQLLLEAWRRLRVPMKLKIVGNGPIQDHLMTRFGDLPGVEWLGWQPREMTLELMKSAKLLVVPSLWFEVLPTTILEAFSVGLPVLAPSLGEMATLIEDGRTGLHFRPQDGDQLCERLTWAHQHAGELTRMRVAARKEYEMKFTAARNGRALIALYQTALAARSRV